MEIALLFGLIVLNGLFAMSEIALVTARRARLQKMVDEGDRSAAAALELGEHPTRFLSTIQIGITSIGVLNGIVGEAALAGPLSDSLQARFEIAEETADLAATATVVFAITYFSIVLGELLPKRLGQINPEPIARIVARPMLMLATLAKPFVRLLTGSTELMMRLFGVRNQNNSAVTEEDIEALLAEGSDAGVIEQQEHQMVRNVFRLDEREILSLMVPRADIVYLDLAEPLETNLLKLGSAGHSRFPVCRGGLDDIIGIASASSLLARSLRGEPLDLAGDLQAAVFVPETQSGMELLDHFRSADVHLALVIDEYGEVQGLVTLQDVLEAITGEFAPTPGEAAWAVQRADGSWLVDGLIPVPELKDRLLLRELPEEDRGRYNTLAGLMMFLLGRVPATTDTVEWESWRFEVVDMDGKRIDKVLASPLPGAEARDGDG
ncbi:HlyC/CorC family transporter [Piscinibacter sp. Jin2]|uniref:HlyC/CorC family transporter n=1 Tax=Aquariibacter lacus TaxID=2801332 RepID=A0A9X0XDW3_9BURK|nr:hemolysin family protein [Piscinibacter lacus]MBL0719032.1 HlyC/CorC family transporter [Piscinibacter lacus]